MFNNGESFRCEGGLIFDPDIERIHCYTKDGVYRASFFWDTIKGYSVE